ncbi:redox-regulated ATPase YchF [Candidatus Woesearchaeota archaeon]|nr:redox-regulated ATPase YchF [Candidatus Woesearchaeota archaeon]
MLIGVVGKPNTGKSTFFKSLTLADVLIANYPFATIDPNKGFGFVRVPCVETFFKTKCNPRAGFCINGTRFVPVEVMDVAGLVPGAHEGRGRGNQFLDDIRRADVLIHVVDSSGGTNSEGEPVQSGSYDPAKDIQFLEEELDYWYHGILLKGWDRFAKQVVQAKGKIVQALEKQISGLRVSEGMIESGVQKLSLSVERPDLWSEQNLFDLARLLRIDSKPMVIAANKCDTVIGRVNASRLQKEFPHLVIIPVSAESEVVLKQASKGGFISYIPGSESFEILKDISEQQKKALEFIREKVVKELHGTGVQKVIDTAVFDVLKYIAVFPGGVGKLEDSEGRRLPDCFLMPPGTTALDFAFHLHTDFGKNFIRAVDVKKKMPVGKDAPLEHCAVIEIKAGK